MTINFSLILDKYLSGKIVIKIVILHVFIKIALLFSKIILFY